MTKRQAPPRRIERQQGESHHQQQQTMMDTYSHHQHQQPAVAPSFQEVQYRLHQRQAASSYCLVGLLFVLWCCHCSSSSRMGVCGFEAPYSYRRMNTLDVNIIETAARSTRTTTTTIHSFMYNGYSSHKKKMPKPLTFSPTSTALSTSTTALQLVSRRGDGGGGDGSSEEHYQSKKFRLEVFKTLNLPQVEVFSVLAVLLSSLLVALDTLQDLPDVAYEGIDNAILTLNIIFAFDFFIRWYAAGQFKGIYLSKPIVVLDILVVIIPLFLGYAIVPLLDSLGATGDLVTYLDGLQNSAGLQNLLLLRVLRLRRILTDINTFGKFEIALGLKPKDVRPYQLQLARVLLSIFTLLSVASGLIYTAEHNVNPDIPDYFSALYFGLTTLTTVGFGDITPITAQGRLIVAGSILAGVAVIPTQAAKLVDIFIESQKDLEQKKGLKKQRPSSSSSSFNSLSGKQPTSVQSATDGRGPSGVSIDIPPKEKDDESPSATISALFGQDNVMVGRTCSQCTASPHRVDATYCWSCGAKL